MKNNYSNPRIDHGHNQGDAFNGKVKTDRVKLAWVGSMALLGTVGSALTVTWSSVIVFLVFTGLTICLGHSLGMHRRFIHRSFDCPAWLEYCLVHLGVLIGLAGPLGMLVTHDTRDWAQRQPRCHAYFMHGSKWYLDFYWQLVCSISLDRPPNIEIEDQIKRNPVYKWMEKTWMWQQLPWAALLFYFGGWGWVCWGIGSRVTVSILGHWLIGYFAHNSGHQSWKVKGAAVQGFNIPYTALLAMGENWHNNHHAYPGSAKMGLSKGQWDPGWWVLKLFEKAGLAWNIITPKQLSVRAELVDC